MKRKIILTTVIILSVGLTYAQDSIQSQLSSIQNDIAALKSSGKTHFMIRGFAQFGLDISEENVNFNMTSFNPVLLWRHGDRFLFESEIEIEYMTNQLSLNLGYANASYIVSKGLVVRMGKFLIPFGTFGEKLHPSWVNKFSTMPLGVGHDGITPMSDIGVEIRGGLQLGKSKMNYSLYAVNGPAIKDGTEEPDEAGMLSFGNAIDNNKNKAIGSRIGILPLSNSSLEIGFSGYYGMPGSDYSPFEGDSINEDIKFNDVTALLTAIDISYVKRISPLKGIIDIKGQYGTSNVSKATYYDPEDTSRYTFTNKCFAYYAQLAYRPSLVENDVLKNFEVVGRYSVYNTPEGSLWENNQSQIDVGLNYWFTWRTVLKMSYQITEGAIGASHDNGMTDMSGMSQSMFLIHLAIGL